MAQSLGALIVNLQVESAQLRKGLDDANSKLDAFGKQAGAAGKLLEQAFGAAAIQKVLSGLSSFVQHGAEVADQMGKMEDHHRATAPSLP